MTINKEQIEKTLKEYFKDYPAQQVGIDCSILAQRIAEDYQPKTISTDMEEIKGKENIWKCSNCKQIFTDKQYELEDDDRCPLCKFPFSQMPYNAPHGVADKTLVKDGKPHLSNKSELKKEAVKDVLWRFAEHWNSVHSEVWITSTKTQNYLEAR